MSDQPRGAATAHVILQLEEHVTALEAEIARLRKIDDDAQRRLRFRQERIDELCADNIALRSQLAECQRQLEAERAGAERRIGAIRDYAEYRADYSAIARGIIKLLDRPGPSTAVMAGGVMDYERLLAKYIAFVGEAEGTTFISAMHREMNDDTVQFTDEEWAELERLAFDSSAGSRLARLLLGC